MSQKDYFSGGSNIYNNLITFKDNIVILPILQNYLLHWYHKYLLYPEMYRIEVMIHQHLYCPVIRNSVRPEVTNCDTCQRTKQPNKQYGKLIAKEYEDIPRNKLTLCIYNRPLNHKRKGTERKLEQYQFRT